EVRNEIERLRPAVIDVRYLERPADEPGDSVLRVIRFGRSAAVERIRMRVEGRLTQVISDGAMWLVHVEASKAAAPAASDLKYLYTASATAKAHVAAAP